MPSRRTCVVAVVAVVAALLVGVHAADAAGRKGRAMHPKVKVVENGESVAPPAECRGVIVGPGVNEPPAFPGYGGFVGWESPIRLRNGTWLVAFSAGYWHASPPTPLRYPAEELESYRKMGMPMEIEAPRGGRAMLTRSADEGRTWSTPETLADTPSDDRHPALLEFPDGRLLCTFFAYQSGKANGEPGSYCRVHVTRSSDGGRTWTTPKPLPSPFASDETDGPILLQQDSSALVVVDGQMPEGGPWQAGVFRTDDQGRTWKLLATVKADHDLSEPSIAQLPDGRLVMIARAEGDICWSSDGGRTWTEPRTFGMRMYAPSLYVLRDGTLLCLHGSYAPGAGGLRAIFSRDGGETWVAPAADHGFLIDTTYGYGKAMELPDGALFAAYLSTGGHQTEDARSNAIWCTRFRIRPDYSGIDLLPAPDRAAP
jgi:sialidase-1